MKKILESTIFLVSTVILICIFCFLGNVQVDKDVDRLLMDRQKVS